MTPKVPKLTKDAVAVLAILPPSAQEEKPGAAVADMAEDLAGNKDTPAQKRIRELIDEIDTKLGRLDRHHASPLTSGKDPRLSYSIPGGMWGRAQAIIGRKFPLELARKKPKSPDPKPDTVQKPYTAKPKQCGAASSARGRQSPAPTVTSDTKGPRRQGALG